MMPPATIRCDVLVVGCGVAGVSAAVRAAREGAQTILLEKNEFPGGAAVAGMHRFICGLYPNGGEIPASTLNGGIAAELSSKLRQLAPARGVQRIGKVHVLPFATRDLVSSLRWLSESEKGLKVLYNRKAVSVRMEHRSIASVTVQERHRELHIAPKAVVDCSGDAVIIQMSGVPYRAPPLRGRQLAGYAFRVKGLRNPDELLPLRVSYHLARAVAEKRMPAHLKLTTYTPGDDPDEGTCRLNLPPLGVDRDARARDQARLVHRYLSRVLDSFEGSEIAETSPRVVDREGPRLCGEYTLTEEDVLGAGRFPDGRVRNAWPIEFWDEARGPSYRYLAPGDYCEIPSRCLKARDISNCWCAGRCISATRRALASTRVIGTCIALGEEAGRAAAHRI
jgi:hypothetical protein